MVAKSKATSWSKANLDATINSKTLQRHINKVWNSASAAPMFRREYQATTKSRNAQGVITLKPKVGADGKPVMLRRSVRLVQGHAYNIACAGAVHAAVRGLKADCDKWGLDYPQHSNHPFMLAVPNGTKLMLEQFLSAYVATGVLKATRMMKAPEVVGPDGKMGKAKHKRLNKCYIKRAFEHLNQAIHDNTGAARATCVVPLKVKKATESGGDFVPNALDTQEEAVQE
jgi:hypothetical protein